MCLDVLLGYVTVASITPTRSPVVDELELLLSIVVGDENNRVTADQLRAFLRKGNDPGLGGLGRHTLLVHLNAHNHGAVLRSEERRVGKECRSRWSPYH